MNGIKFLVLGIAKYGMKAIYLPIKLFPRRDKTVFISRQSDVISIDMAMLKDRLKEVRPEHEVVVLARKLRPNLSYLLHVVAQMYHISTSRNVVLDSYCIPVSVLNHKKGLNVIQMWHAIGSMKCFGYAMLGQEEGSHPEIAKLFRMHDNYNYILISSMSFIKDFEEGFHAKREQVKVVPLPKADLLTDKEYMEKERMRARNELSLDPEKKVILYCPTFRKTVDERDREAVNALASAVDFSKYILAYKPHPLSTLKIDDERVIKLKGNNITAMALADYIISDYSSIIYEAGLAEKKVYLYAYDWDYYKEKRTLNLDLKKEVPTIFTDSPVEIMRAIEDENYRTEEFKAFIEKNVTMPEGRCTDKIIELLN